jgi:putative phosphoserine phosphatase/1-acylglycerol-3-phosphate O-acyltransferase
MERKEIKEAKEVKEKNGDVAAFFDLDGTLSPKPSLEKRFFSMLRYRHLIGLRSYFLWLAEAVRFVPGGISQIMHANKMYLRGVRMDEAICGADISFPPFFPEAIERMGWHGERGHSIVIVSGSLEPLALLAARALEAELGARRRACKIHVCATRLEEENERWSGRIVGEAMFGEAKAKATRRIAAEMDLDLLQCFAYGDSTSDKWMLEAVGKPTAINPSSDLVRIARRNDWPILCWRREKDFTQSARRTQRARRMEKIEKGLRAESVNTGHGA